MKNGYIIRLEIKEDYRQVEFLTREAFWNVYRPGCYEHFVVHRFHEKRNFIPELTFVMERDEKIIGHIMYVRSEIRTNDDSSIPIMTFGPISIAPDYQRQGYGTALLRYSMEKAEKMGAGALAITGGISFYGKFGFAPGKERGILYAQEPDADYFLVKELTSGFLKAVRGVYKDPEGYFVPEAEVAQFDKGFPPKEKKRLPGQLV